MAALSDEMKAKISEGMKRAHQRKKKWKREYKDGNKKAPVSGNSLLGHLRAERAELDLLIQALEKRGYR
jgi:hypothetical protein